MLQELRIKDFAIIDELVLILTPGFLVITGETGAGKSILVDAVNLLLGDRSDTSLVRAETDRAVIEGRFLVPGHVQAALQAVLETEGLEGDTPDEVLLTREVRANGRSQSRVNGIACSLNAYREVGGLLVDIHGQGEHLSLLKASQHLYLLDRYAHLEDERAALRELVRELGALRAEINSLLTDEEALARRIDMLQYQVQEIETAEPRTDEEDELRQERNRMANAEKIAELATEVQFALSGDVGETSAVDLLAQAAIVLSKLAKLDPSLEDDYQLAETISMQADELARTIRLYRENIEYEPRRLDQIEERLEILNRLKRKYGGTIDAVLDHAERARAELDQITHSEERLAELRAAEDRLLHRIGQEAGQLSARRQDAGARLTDGIVRELGDLRMQGARFDVQIAQLEDPDGCYVGGRRLAFDGSGIDRVEFYMAANVGEPLRPLVKVASGGEAARIMLALKSVLSHADQIPTLIFDEIDQGIGGRLGTVVGQKLWGLSDTHQVLCVTHLAQLAGFGDAHYRVSKHVENDRTVTRVEHLDDHGRVDELAEMLGAETTAARQSAFDILMLARRAKEGRRIETA
ncbi:DNA repair protein RecN [Aggregatilinea lenta]|uniref:DNA repair protein RecN n=1 Tax=Aggregatilinea lenta TaxID=913108 RepID=UPI000E5B0D55|nr:DNA repair protein RecN [Aggregatilinea lenta]